MTLSKAQKDSRRVRKFKDDPVKRVTGVPNNKPNRKFEYTAGEHYNQEEENDMDTDTMAAGPVYDVEDE